MQNLPTIHKKQMLSILAAMFFLSVSATDIYIASLPQMVLDFHSNPSIINLTISLHIIGIAIGVLFTGEISNYFGRRNTLLTGVFLFSIGSLLISLSTSIYLILFFRIVQAMGTATIMIVPRLILKDSMNQQEQIHANGVLLLGLIISPALAPVIGAYLAKYFTWRSCFSVSSICGFISLYFSYKFLPETNSTPTTKLPSLQVYLNNYIKIMQNTSFIYITMIYACAVGAYFAFIGVSSYLYINYWHMSPVNYSYVFFSLSLAYLLGNQIMQYLNRRQIDPLKIIGFGVYSTLFGMLIVLLSLLVSNQLAIIIIMTSGIFFMRIANALINPPTHIVIMKHFTSLSAQALGLNMCCGFVAMSIATYLVTLFPKEPLASLVVINSVFISLCLIGYVLFKRKSSII